MKRLVLTAALLGACGGNDTGPISAAEAREGCQKICARDEACEAGPPDVEGCTADCVEDVGTWPRADVFSDFTDCLADVPCETDADACYATVTRLSIHDEWEEKCVANLATCPDSATSAEECSLDGDDEAVTLRLIAEPIMEELVACLDAADCATRLACLDAVIEEYGIDF